MQAVNMVTQLRSKEQKYADLFSCGKLTETGNEYKYIFMKHTLNPWASVCM
jgi:hypothetical protein